MRIDRVVRTITTSGGSGSENTLDIQGGLCRQIYIIAGTSTTTFRANIVDPDSLNVRRYDFHREEINDSEVLPMVGIYTIQITNASADGPFTCRMLIEE